LAVGEEECDSAGENQCRSRSKDEEKTSGDRKDGKDLLCAGFAKSTASMKLRMVWGSVKPET
jgi:hypothetical protein